MLIFNYLSMGESHQRGVELASVLIEKGGAQWGKSGVAAAVEINRWGRVTHGAILAVCCVCYASIISTEKAIIKQRHRRFMM
ncbi:hypothetical protein [Pseudomonas sp. EL_65y_Pfl1_R32]|uniref:hypothetical protein n=1 Tax=Pseudomonas sp. EL_65y_Pfl1_R32 TaxID=3088696 RepID=UPI0030DD2CEF